MKRQIKPRRKGKGRNNLFKPEFLKTKVVDGESVTTLTPLGKDMMGSLIDVALGVMFVSALKKTGTREAMIKILFPEEEKGGEATEKKV